MYLPQIQVMPINRRSIADSMPLADSHFTLDTSGVAGFFGGDEAVSAMATVHVYEGRKWLGWYNSPGAYDIGKRYGRLANSRFWDGLFPGVNTDPATLFELDGLKGPKYRAAQSGTILPDTSHLGALFAKECAAREAIQVPGRITTPVGVTIADLSYVPPFETNPKRLRTKSGLVASIPITVSIGACVVSGLVEDWFSFTMILLGILSSGISCFVIGSGKFTFNHPRPADGAPRGDGVLFTERETIILQGEEAAVNVVTRGKFSLRFSSEPEYRNIGWCSMLLTIQFVAQLLLIPQGTLFGQILFVASLGVSWGYNSYLSSLDKEQIQREILMKNVLMNPPLKKYMLGTRSTMAIFVLLILKPAEPDKMLEEFVPNDTRVWRVWRDVVLQRIRKGVKLDFEPSDSQIDGLTDEERKLLAILFADAQAAYTGFISHSQSLTKER
ncbi:hypothetical protein BJ138DRAFT_1174536 [Hygrophoropsis aurantiaca]|uniref:Uncharacterized protein n=1 Tax=Hygrophoropsis aurantiaca TaxID=72124 RepID=A0ACB8A407_9AGAM|nr:hypothetical protein BJ138DRAFT_1174536 [Hygrophoropsis aurantiaca]